MRVPFVLMLIALTADCFGQKKVAEASLPGQVVYACVDRPGDLYVILANGTTLKFDKDGRQIGERKFAVVPTLFDPKDGTRAFAYFRESQTVQSIAPDLSFADTSPLHPEFAVSAWLVCPSKNEYWLLDAADVTLKKTKDKGLAIAYETSFANGESDVKKIPFMREYLNFLFMLDSESGIHVLNNLGKDIRRIETGSIGWFGFLGEELYYPAGDHLELVDLYTTEKRTIELPHPARFALLTDTRLMLIGDKSVEMFEFQP